jgi:SAM-dependent methyltransferase
MERLRRWTLKLRYRGPVWALQAVRDRIRPYRLPGWKRYAARLAGADALEVGGPSSAFERRGLLPLYDRLASVDNAQFAARTTWQGHIGDGEPLKWGRVTGRQKVRDATDLRGLGPYDTVLASHILEHVADPLRALGEWYRVLRPGGYLIVITPDPARMFDHRRPVTTMEHLRADDSVGEGDMTHLAEVLALDDRTLSDDPTSRAEMEPLWRDNPSTRTLHHHVYDADLLTAAVREAGFRIVAVEQVWPYHTVCVASR